VYNGDIGMITSINEEEKEAVILFDNKILVYEFSDLDEITLAYAVTIHKSQGSEYHTVIIPVLMEHFIMLQRNLLYTAITRGKKLVILVGQKRAVEISVTQKNEVKRYSSLKKRLLEAASA
jgi:exodeoxyribonuclease V alpha subunit